MIWKFFSNPIICLDGDQSGQKAALRIAEKLFPFINETNKIYFSIMPEGNDPDDFIKKNTKDGFIKLLENKIVIQQYLWTHYLNKIDKTNPFEISSFENFEKLFLSNYFVTTINHISNYENIQEHLWCHLK